MFFLFFGLSHPLLAIKKTGKRFFDFLIFFFYFFRNFLAQVEYERNSGLNFLSLSLSRTISSPVLAKNNAIKWFFNFFSYFFRNFLARVENEWNSGLNFFFFFVVFSLSHPVLAKNNAGKGFLNFLNFFAIFFGIFFPGPSMNGIRD